MKDTAVNILATIEGIIRPDDPRGEDEIAVKLTRTRVKPKNEVKYVERTRTKRTPKES